MKAYIQLVLAMSNMAKEMRNASPVPQQTENQKYAMYWWMRRLGMIGDEFETARALLTRKLEGHTTSRFAA